MSQETFDIHLGSSLDSLTLLPVQLMRLDENGVETPINTSAGTVKFKLVDPNRVTIIAETATGVTATDATVGKHNFDFNGQSIPGGKYYGYFTYTESSRVGHFPVKTHELKVQVHLD